MNKPPVKKYMDVATPRQQGARRSGWKLTRKQMAGIGLSLFSIALLVVGIYWFMHRNELRIDHARYQAVFLDDGKVFFGKLQNSDGKYLTLHNAFYTQGQNESAGAQASEPTSVQLVKVGDETYGPDSSMSIDADNVLFWQNLKADSKVTQAIESNK